MKAYRYPVALPVLLLLANAQAQQKIINRPLPQNLPQESRQVELKIAEPEITSPKTGTAIKPGEDFVVSGMGLAQGEVTVRIMPIYSGSQPPRSALNGGEAKYYDAQNFTVTVNAFGSWRLPPTQVRFGDGASNRKVHIFVAQKAGGVDSRGKVLEYPVASNPRIINRAPANQGSDQKALEQFSITAPTSVSREAKAPVTIPLNRSNPFRIRGAASADSRIVVETRFNGRTVQKRNSFKTTLGIPRNHVDEKISRHDNKLVGQWELTPDGNGQWQTPAIDPYTRKVIASHSVVGIPTVNDTDEVIMEKVTVTVRLQRNGRTLREYTLWVMPML